MDSFGFGCPYPGCGWSMEVEPGMPKDTVNRILHAHLQKRHPLWTPQELEGHFRRRQKQLRAR